MPTDPHHHALHAIRQRIAAAIVPPPVSRTLGDIALHPHQQDAVAQLLEILPLHHGALLADDVGLGKTFVALAVARHYTEVHCIAPATLCAMWRTAAKRAGVHDLQVHSLHALAKQTPEPFGDGTRALVIIDEAHALRNPKTARYRAAATACLGADVLLISATPLHNRAHDLRALFALFAGARADTLSPRRLESLMVRRRAEEVETSDSARPAVVHHAPLHMPQDQETLTQLLALPAPLPAHDGAVAGALIRLGLLRGWCSSDAAFATALRRRRLRTAALRDVLRTGRHATNTELRSWLVGDDAGQLAFPELLVEQRIETGAHLEVLERHLQALTTLADHHDTVAHADHQRTDTLRALLGKHDGTPIVAFSQFAATIESLYRALSDIAGVAMLHGQTARIASGSTSRMDVLECFAPRAHGRAPPPAHRRIRLLLTTDLLSEGVNLQDAGVVVHLDLPWTAARREQRIGRCVRMGSLHPVVHSYRLAASAHAEHHLRAERLILHKQRLHDHYIGRHTRGAPTVRPRKKSIADSRRALYALLNAWHTPASDGNAPTESAPDTTAPHVVMQRAECDGAIIRYEEQLCTASGMVQRRQARVIALVPSSNQTTWRCHHDIRTLLTVAKASTTADAPEQLGHQQRRTAQARARRAWRRFCSKAYARRIIGPPAREQRIVAGRLIQHITQIVQQLPSDQRTILRLVIRDARLCATAARGAAADVALQRWAAQYGQLSPIDWLTAWRRDPALRRYGDKQHDTASTPDHHRWQLVLCDVLLLVRRP